MATAVDYPQHDIYKLMNITKRKASLKGEALLQAQIVDILKTSSITGDLKCIWFHIPNSISDAKNPRYGSFLSHMGKIQGAPDLCLISPKITLLVELKTQKGTLSEHQKLFKKWCSSQKVPYIVVRTLREFKSLLVFHDMIDGSKLPLIL